MSTESDVIKIFYDAFARRDAKAMVACYHDEIVFRDPVFGELHGDQVKDMWRMLCWAGKDLRVVASGITGDSGSGSAHWEADYTFATRRHVHNVVDSSFSLSGGLIFRQMDEFDLVRWAGQAFGPPGEILGRTPLLSFGLQRLVRLQLSRFSAARRRRGR